MKSYITMTSVPSMGLSMCRLMIWPGLRVLLRVIAVPLSVVIGWPAGFAVFACLFAALNQAGHGYAGSAFKMLLAGFACASLVALAYWPRRALRPQHR